MSGKRRFKKSVERLNIKKVDRIIEIPALLGLAIGGEKLVDVPGREGYVYARIRDNLNEVVQAYNSQVSQIYDLPVILIRDQVNKSRYIVKERDLGRYSDWGNSAYLPRHHSQHEFDPDLAGNDITWIYDKQWMPFAIVPSGSSGAGNVLTKPTIYWQNGDWHYLGYTGTQNILTYKPTGSHARMVLVYADDNGNPQLTAGGFFSSSVTGTGYIVDQIPDVPDPTVDMPLGAIRLVSGTSRILWGNIYRTFMVGGGGGSASGFTTGSVLFSAPDGTITEDNPHFFYNDTTDMLIVGSNAYPVSTTPQIAAVNDGAAASAVLAYGSVPFFSTYRANNVQSLPSGIALDDVFGRFIAGGYAAGAWQAYAVAIEAVATENWASGKLGSRWDFYANTTGSSTPALAFSISGDRVKANKIFSVGDAEDVTVISRTITLSPSRSHYRVYSSNTGNPDDLDTIYGGKDGDLLFLEPGYGEGESIVIHDVASATDPDANIWINNGLDWVLGADPDGNLIVFMYSEYKAAWYMFGYNLT